MALAWNFVCRLVRSQAAHFVIDQRQQLLGILRIAGVHGTQELCDVGHTRDYARCRRQSEFDETRHLASVIITMVRFPSPAPVEKRSVNQWFCSRAVKK